MINMTNVLISEHPAEARFKVMLLTLNELKDEISKPQKERNKMSHLHYGVIRVYDDMLSLENTPFCEEMGKLLIELNAYD